MSTSSPTTRAPTTLSPTNYFPGNASSGITTDNVDYPIVVAAIIGLIAIGFIVFSKSQLIRSMMNIYPGEYRTPLLVKGSDNLRDKLMYWAKSDWFSLEGVTEWDKTSARFYVENMFVPVFYMCWKIAFLVWTLVIYRAHLLSLNMPKDYYVYTVVSFACLRSVIDDMLWIYSLYVIKVQLSNGIQKADNGNYDYLENVVKSLTTLYAFDSMNVSDKNGNKAYRNLAQYYRGMNAATTPTCRIVIRICNLLLFSTQPLIAASIVFYDVGYTGYTPILGLTTDGSHVTIMGLFFATGVLLFLDDFARHMRNDTLFFIRHLPTWRRAKQEKVKEEEGRYFSNKDEQVLLQSAANESGSDDIISYIDLVYNCPSAAETGFNQDVLGPRWIFKGAISTDYYPGRKAFVHSMYYYAIGFALWNDIKQATAFGVFCGSMPFFLCLVARSFKYYQTYSNEMTFWFLCISWFVPGVMAYNSGLQQNVNLNFLNLPQSAQNFGHMPYINYGTSITTAIYTAFALAAYQFLIVGMNEKMPKLKLSVASGSIKGTTIFTEKVSRSNETRKKTIDETGIILT